MTQLGYAFRCNGRKLVPVGTVFDLAYDGGPVRSNEVVAAEAKGSLRSGATANAVKTITQAGYTAQVEPHIGQTYLGATVLHGYAIGTGSELKTGVACHMHVEETAWVQASAGVSAPSGSGGSGISGTRQPNATLAIENYRAVFRLLGQGGILGALDAVLARRWPLATSIAQQTLLVVNWRSNRYVTGGSVIAHPGVAAFQRLFGLRLDVAAQFLDGLSSCIANQDLPRRFPLELVVRQLDTPLELHLGDGGTEFPDGLTYFGPTPPQPAAGALHWSPMKGTF